MSSKPGKKKNKVTRWGNEATAKPAAATTGGRGGIVGMETDEARKIRHVAYCTQVMPPPIHITPTICVYLTDALCVAVADSSCSGGNRD